MVLVPTARPLGRRIRRLLRALPSAFALGRCVASAGADGTWPQDLLCSLFERPRWLLELHRSGWRWTTDPRCCPCTLLCAYTLLCACTSLCTCALGSWALLGTWALRCPRALPGICAASHLGRSLYEFCLYFGLFVEHPRATTRHAPPTCGRPWVLSASWTGPVASRRVAVRRRADSPPWALIPRRRRRRRRRICRASLCKRTGP